jgi:hypothetical protein
MAAFDLHPLTAPNAPKRVEVVSHAQILDTPTMGANIAALARRCMR